MYRRPWDEDDRPARKRRIGRSFIQERLKPAGGPGQIHTAQHGGRWEQATQLGRI